MSNLPMDKIQTARKLRRNQTDAEKMLWHYLRNRQLCGSKFRRQFPVGKYVADFCCVERKLMVELDGGQHDLAKEKDKKRDEWFKNHGYKVLRFWDNEVFKNTDGVLETIRKKLLAPHLTSPARGEEKQKKSTIKNK